jgi:hypothetical protein
MIPKFRLVSISPSWRRSLAVAACALCPSLAAQVPRQIVVRVRVVDTTDTPIVGAEVSVIRGLNTKVVSGPSDAGGMRVLIVPRDEEAYQVVARRIGYERTERFFARPISDTVAMQIELHHVARELAPVTVTEGENRTRRHYHLGADEIANSTRPLFDATDVLTKLRPEMMGGTDCSLQYVWVNGRRIDFAPTNEMALLRRGRLPRPAPKPTLVFQGDGSSGRAPPSSAQQRVADDPWSVLASIKPEHILELNYIDCYIADPVHKKGSENAVYVALKAGIAFEPGTGSFVVDTARTDRANVLPPTRAAGVSRLAAYRLRLLGVYDRQTGEPIPGVDVIDLATGTRGHTSVTGTVSLFYLEPGESAIRLHHAGYRDQDMDVTISPTTTTPITVVLTPVP